MKPRNFPGRKTARQLAAKEGGSRDFYAVTDRAIQAATQRSKKPRVGRRERTGK